MPCRTLAPSARCSELGWSAAVPQTSSQPPSQTDNDSGQDPAGQVVRSAGGAVKPARSPSCHTCTGNRLLTAPSAVTCSSTPENEIVTSWPGCGVQVQPVGVAVPLLERYTVAPSTYSR